MPVRRKKRPAPPPQYRPPLPPELGVYQGAAWGAPPLDGDATAWEAGHRAAYARFEQACRTWCDQYAHLPVSPSAAPDDEVWCGDFDDHECGGADCWRRPSPGNVLPRNAQEL